MTGLSSVKIKLVRRIAQSISTVKMAQFSSRDGRGPRTYKKSRYAWGDELAGAQKIRCRDCCQDGGRIERKAARSVRWNQVPFT